MSVQRFSVGALGTVASETGPWVRYKDYAIIEAENKTMRASLGTVGRWLDMNIQEGQDAEKPQPLS